MEKGFGLDVPRGVGLENLGKDFFCRLHEPLGPARLLRFETVHVYGKLGSTFNLRKVEEFPAFELGAIGKIRVLSKRVVFPASGILNGLAAPHAGSAVEVEESAAAGARAVLHDEVAIKQYGFDVGEQRVVAVEIGPSRLHHADFFAAVGTHEIGNGAAEKIGLWQKVASKMATNSPLAVFRPFSRAPALKPSRLVRWM